MTRVETRLASALSIIGREALRIVLPSWCVVCHRELPWRARVASCCGNCWRSLPRITSGMCRSCALPLPGADMCIRCSADPLPVGWCDAWGEYAGGLERLLHAFKFERHEFLDAPLASLLHETMLARGDLDFDFIVPVPMHWTRERRRGYNQAQLLGVALSKLTGIRCDARLLTKRHENETQSLLARAARAGNVRHTFEASPRAEGLSLLVVDDICTTAETLRACARELLQAGARRVCAISVAKAV
jgi:competence protein ComFC